MCIGIEYAILIERLKLVWLVKLLFHLHEFNKQQRVKLYMRLHKLGPRWPCVELKPEHDELPVMWRYNNLVEECDVLHKEMFNELDANGFINRIEIAKRTKDFTEVIELMETMESSFPKAYLIKQLKKHGVNIT